jgi:hypothetical protein
VQTSFENTFRKSGLRPWPRAGLLFPRVQVCTAHCARSCFFPRRYGHSKLQLAGAELHRGSFGRFIEGARRDLPNARLLLSRKVSSTSGTCASQPRGSGPFYQSLSWAGYPFDRKVIRSFLNGCSISNTDRGRRAKFILRNRQPFFRGKSPSLFICPERQGLADSGGPFRNLGNGSDQDKSQPRGADR